MRRTAAWVGIGALLCCVAFVLYYDDRQSAVQGESTLSLGDTHIRVRVADTEAERAQGLSGSNPLSEREGMLFVFPHPEKPGFWMKDMRFPIDILWISADRVLVGYKENVTPDTFPKAFYPSEPIVYVLEVPAGFVKKNNIQLHSVAHFKDILVYPQ